MHVGADLILPAGNTLLFVKLRVQPYIKHNLITGLLLDGDLSECRLSAFSLSLSP